jgi:hypothetical protein
MNGEHIEQLLDQGLRNLTESERQTIESHTSVCQPCLNRYNSALFAEKLIIARAHEDVPVPPFFSTRVMAELRARQGRTAFSFESIWKTARVLLASMISVVTILVALTVYASWHQVSVDLTQDDDMYTTEWAIVDEADPTADVTDNQVLTTLYEPADANGQDN